MKSTLTSVRKLCSAQGLFTSLTWLDLDGAGGGATDGDLPWPGAGGAGAFFFTEVPTPLVPGVFGLLPESRLLMLPASIFTLLFSY